MTNSVKNCGTLLLLLNVILLVSSQGSVSNNTEGNIASQNTSRTEGRSRNNTPPAPHGVEQENRDPLHDIFYILLISILSVIGVTAVITAGVCWYRHSHMVIATERVLYRSSDSSVLIHNGGPHEHNNGKNGAHQLSGLAKRTDYPAYGVTGPNPLHDQSYETPVDGTLSKDAEMYHYNQTKKRMKPLSSSATSESSSPSKTFDPHDVAAELEANDEETSDGEYTVYECSGLAAAIDGPMEVHNPLFDDMLDKTDTVDYSYQDGKNRFHQNPSFVRSQASTPK